MNDTRKIKLTAKSEEIATPYFHQHKARLDEIRSLGFDVEVCYQPKMFGAICKKCGHETLVQPRHFDHTDIAFYCHNCGEQPARRKSSSVAIEISRETNEQKLIAKNVTIIKRIESTDNNHDVLCECKVCKHQFTGYLSYLALESKYPCEVCRKKVVSESHPATIKAFNLIDERLDNLKLSRVDKTNTIKISEKQDIQCNECGHIFNKKLSNFVHDAEKRNYTHGCPECRMQMKLKNNSDGEK